MIYYTIFPTWCQKNQYLWICNLFQTIRIILTVFLNILCILLKKHIYNLQQLCTWRTLLLQTIGDTFCSTSLPLPKMSLTSVFDFIVRVILGFQKNAKKERQFGPYFILLLLAPRQREQCRSSLTYSEPH